jgi:hypothetical protein
LLLAEARRQFGKPEEGERLLLEAITRKLVKTQQVEKTYYYFIIIICGVGLSP